MAKYEVLFACGHTATIQLYGKHTERESYIEWCKKNRMCPECYERKKEEEKKKRIVEYERKAKEAAAEAENLGLPELEGSEKQVSWAMSIRKDQMSIADAAFDYIKKYFDRKEYDKEKVLEIAQDWLRGYKLQNKASFWIDNRYNDERDLARACVKRALKKIDGDNK